MHKQASLHGLKKKYGDLHSTVYWKKYKVGQTAQRQEVEITYFFHLVNDMDERYIDHNRLHRLRDHALLLALT